MLSPGLAVNLATSTIFTANCILDSRCMHLRTIENGPLRKFNTNEIRFGLNNLFCFVFFFRFCGIEIWYNQCWFTEQNRFVISNLWNMRTVNITSYLYLLANHFVQFVNIIEKNVVVSHGFEKKFWFLRFCLKSFVFCCLKRGDLIFSFPCWSFV